MTAAFKTCCVASLRGGCAAWGLMVLAGCGPAPPRAEAPRPVRTVAVQDASAVARERGAAYLAIVKGRNQLTLSFKVPGIVEMIGPGADAPDWQEGAEFKRGQELARLKASDFVAALNSATAQAELDRRQYERASRLMRDGATSQQELDRALAAKQASEAMLELRRQDLQDSRIMAPMDGTVLKREVNAGETVGAGQAVLTVADLSEVEVEVGVPDRLVGSLRVGSRVALSISALGNDAFTGEVTEVGVSAREGSRLFRVIVTVKNADGAIRPGMAASVYLDDASELPRGVLVPLSALVARSDRHLAVFVASNGVAFERPVETRDIVASSIVVVRGLEAGEQVVVSGASQLHDGAVIRPVSWPERGER